MADEPLEDRVLRYFGRRHAAVVDHLVSSLGEPQDEVEVVLSQLVRNGWLSEGSAWYGNDPSNAITIYVLQPAGEEELAGRERLREPAEEPVVVTRDELVGALKRRFAMTDDAVATNVGLSGELFWYWPSIGAFAAIQ